MANVLVERNSLSDIADSIRAKNGTQNTYKPAQMAAAIDAIPSGGVLGTKTITANGTYDAEDDDLDGYSEVTVNVSGGSSEVYTGSVTPTERLSTASFYAPNATRFAIYPTSAPATDTGYAFFAGGVGVVGRLYGARSVDAGNNYTGGVNPNVTLSKSGDNFVLTFQGTEPRMKCLQVGITYDWIAW